MISRETEIALSISCLTNRLISHNFIEDTPQVNHAISAVAKKVINNLTPVKDRSLNSRLTHIAQMIESGKKSRQKLEVLKRKMNEAKTGELQSYPKINKNSKKICQREELDIVSRNLRFLKQKNERLNEVREMKEKAQNEEFLKNCSFSPFNRNKSSRLHSEVVQGLYDWKTGKEKRLDKKIEENQERIKKEVYLTPKINKEIGYRRCSPNVSEIERESFVREEEKLQSHSRSSNDVRIKDKKITSDFSVNISEKYTYEEIVKMLSCNSSFA